MGKNTLCRKERELDCPLNIRLFFFSNRFHFLYLFSTFVYSFVSNLYTQRGAETHDFQDQEQHTLPAEPTRQPSATSFIFTLSLFFLQLLPTSLLSSYSIVVFPFITRKKQEKKKARKGEKKEGRKQKAPLIFPPQLLSHSSLVQNRLLSMFCS